MPEAASNGIREGHRWKEDLLAKNLVDTSYHVSWVPTLPIKSSQVVDVFNSDEPMTTAAVSVYKHRAAINLEEQVSSQCTL
eukprot:SAG25_NODE_5663_length_633_cov_2.413858_1_plen_80_part_01